jgi:hypothetical protein
MSINRLEKMMNIPKRNVLRDSIQQPRRIVPAERNANRIKREASKRTSFAWSAAAFALLIVAGISGCGIDADPPLTSPSQASASGARTLVTPPAGSKEWNDANWGDTGL